MRGWLVGWLVGCEVWDGLGILGLHWISSREALLDLFGHCLLSFVLLEAGDAGSVGALCL